jgi:asparagine synthase (glutamine-hydrolysing)
MLPRPSGPGGPWGIVDFPESDVCLACEVEARTPGLPSQGPARSEDAALGAVFAGWLHNSVELRARYPDLPAGATESHLLLRLYRDHGPGLVARLQGRFVFALWDRDKEQLVLGRDAVGVRVLYTLEDDEGLFFASRIKALLRSGRSRAELDPRAVDTLLALRRTPGAATLVSDIRRLPAGHQLVRRHGVSRLRRWFELDLQARPIGPEEAQEELTSRLSAAVARCCPPDEAVGLYYSGGLDSTTLLELACRHADGAVEAVTFLHGKGHGDFLNARRWTRRLDVRHEEVDVRDLPFETLFPEALWILDDPIADLSVLSPFMLARTTSRRVRYSMDGIGADQALGGSFHHRPLHFLLRRGSLPGLAPLLRLVGRGVERAPIGTLNRLIEQLEPAYSVDPEGRRRIARLLGSVGEPREALKLLICLLQEEQRASLYTAEQAERLRGAGGPWQPPDFIGGTLGADEQMNRLFEFEILESMAHCQCRASESFGQHHGLEHGAPFLDPEVLRFLFRLPFRLKIDGWKNKVVLRRHWAARADPIQHQPKQAGNIAIDRVFGARVRAFCGDVLTPDRLREGGLFRPEAVDALLQPDDGPDGMICCMQAMVLASLELWRQMYLGSTC